MPIPRIPRLSQQLQEEIALIIHRELKDPGVGFVTITRVELSKDLSHAKVLFSCLGAPQQRLECQEALERSAGYIHGLIKKRLRLRITPALTFRYDESIEHSIELSNMLDRLKETQDNHDT